MQSQGISHLTENKEPNKDLKIMLFRQKSETQHTFHWDQLQYAQCIKHLTQVFQFYFIYHPF